MGLMRLPVLRQTIRRQRLLVLCIHVRINIVTRAGRNNTCGVALRQGNRTRRFVRSRSTEREPARDATRLFRPTIFTDCNRVIIAKRGFYRCRPVRITVTHLALAGSTITCVIIIANIGCAHSNYPPRGRKKNGAFPARPLRRLRKRKEKESDTRESR